MISTFDISSGEARLSGPAVFRDSRRRAIVVSALLHIGAVVIIVAYRAPHLPAVVAVQSLAVSVIPAAMPAAPEGPLHEQPRSAPPPPVVTPLQTSTTPSNIWPPRPIARPTPRRPTATAPTPRHVTRPPRRLTAEPMQQLRSSPPLPPKPVPPPPPDARSIAALEEHISHAVNEAKYYPPSARLEHREGRVAVSFSYRDGAVTDILLLHSSQSAMLDRAALAAVRLARYPTPRSSLNGFRLRLTVWLAFSLVAFD
jgi:TonB family protein